jgi:hypothetical protein
MVGVAEVSYSHASGSVFPRGDTTVTVTAKDAAGNQSATAFTVTVILSDTAHTALAAQGDPVPGAGIDPRIPAGAVWASFGVPAISATGKVGISRNVEDVRPDKDRQWVVRRWIALGQRG